MNRRNFKNRKGAFAPGPNGPNASMLGSDAKRVNARGARLAAAMGIRYSMDG